MEGRRMALYFLRETSQEWIEVHLPLPKMSHPVRIVAIQADGHELEHIRELFKNIPMTDKRVVSWHGETANFIAHNW
jgi:hypothetical protein